MSNDFDFDPNAAPEPSPSVADESSDDSPDKGKKGKKQKKQKKQKPEKKSKKAKASKKSKSSSKKKRGKTSPARDGDAPQAKQWNVYTALLLVTLLCLTIGSLMLYMELMRYGSFPWWKTDGI